MKGLMLQDTALLRNADLRGLTAQISADLKLYKKISSGFLYPDDEKLKEEHFRLFGPNPLCPLDIVCYLSDNEFMQARIMADIAGFYRAFGLHIQEGLRVDNLSICFEFLAYLCLKKIYATEKGLDEKLKITDDAYNSFLNEFVLPALPKFLSALRKNTTSRFYQGLADLAEGLLKNQ